MRCFALTFATGLTFMSAAAGGSVTDFKQGIPRKLLDWVSTGDDAVYDRKTIFDYMDGGAEVYLAFDFKEVFVREFKTPTGDQIALDIYDMGSSAEAFGVFTCDREDPGAGIGQESEYGLGLLRFWQGRYFVSVTVAGDEEKAERAVLELGKAVAPLLGPPGEPPSLIKLLPETGLLKDKTSFFHSVINLNNRFFVSSDNILNLEPGKTDCLLAEYSTGDKETGKLLLIQYPDDVQAEAARQSFLRAFLPEAAETGTALTENKKWVLARLKKNLLSIVFEAPSKEWAENLVSIITVPSK